MAAFPATALIAAGGQIASTLFNKPKTFTPAQQIASTVKGARSAGIHPLAALGSGAQYSTVSGGANAGSAIGAGIEKFAQHMAMRKTDAEVAALAASTEAQKAQAELYRQQSRTLIQRIGNRSTGGPPVSDQMPSAASPKTIRAFGQPLTRDPKKFSSAQDAQDEFGEPAEWIVGLPSMVESIGRDGPNRGSVWDKADLYREAFQDALRHFMHGGKAP